MDLEDRILNGPTAGYCSSSEDEEEEPVKFIPESELIEQQKGGSSLRSCNVSQSEHLVKHRQLFLSLKLFRS